jgi:hypothetical protein
MLFLLDANVLIDANRDYYPLDGVPEFWEWLIYQGEQGSVKIPIEIYEEITDGKKDELASWMKRLEVRDALLLDQEADINLVQEVVRKGYSENLSDTELQQLGRDPFLISYALFPELNGSVCVVTTEISKPSKKRANKHVPDVCATFSITSRNAFEFSKILGFRTGWKNYI